MDLFYRKFVQKVLINPWHHHPYLHHIHQSEYLICNILTTLISIFRSYHFVLNEYSRFLFDDHLFHRILIQIYYTHNNFQVIDFFLLVAIHKVVDIKDQQLNYINHYIISLIIFNTEIRSQS